jgi:ComF family protein
MAQTFLTYNAQSGLKTANQLIVPVPTATKRIRQRSFDHTLLLARGLSRKLKLDRASVLARSGQISQVGAPRSIRLAQAEQHYLIKNPAKAAGRNILIIDDVLTTGATLRAITKILRAAGATQVDALVFAKRL